MLKLQYQLKITLLELEPAIWRRFVVPSNITLIDLHQVIQIVMGWTNSHLHEFTIGKYRYTDEPEEFEELGHRKSTHFRLQDVIKRNGSKFNYVYDYGDYWQHEIVLENPRYIPELDKDFYCLEGKGGCPPEDVGGVSGYYDLCLASSDIFHEDHTYYRELYEGGFKPAKFDRAMVNLELLKFNSWKGHIYLSS